MERARGLGVGLLLAPQALARLSPGLRTSVLANVGTIAAFRLSRAEAKLVADELPGITTEQLQHLERFHVALRLGLGPGDLSPVMTGSTLPPSDPHGDTESLRAHAARRWGSSLAEVDQALTVQPPSSAPANAPPIAFPGSEPRAGRVPRRST